MNQPQKNPLIWLSDEVMGNNPHIKQFKWEQEAEDEAWCTHGQTPEDVAAESYWFLKGVKFARDKCIEEFSKFQKI